MERRGDILTQGGWVRGRIVFGARIDTIEGRAVETPRPPFILPGFVDLHCHGGGGADVMEGADAVRRAACLHAAHGTTTFLPTTVTAPVEAIGDALSGIADAMRRGEGARIAGAHLEGPFLNPGKLGAQPPHAISGDAALFTRWAGIVPVRVATVAPEAADEALAAAMARAGTRAQIGHTLCDYALAAARLSAGWGITHLYNAMSPCAHRGNGAAGAALAHADYAEIIPDLLHVEPGAILAARRAIPNLYGVTDASAGAGAPDGTYPLGAHRATKHGEAIRLADGTLAGSCLTMDRALRNLVRIGLPLAEAVRRLSTIPADWIGAQEAGRLAPGLPADLTCFDETLTLLETLIGGDRHA